MKRIISLLILITALSSITYFTYYTLTHKEIKEEVEEKVNKKIERVTSNLTNNRLSEIYNIYLNKEKHKLKLEYTHSYTEEGTTNITVYFDGISILNELISINNETNLESLLLNETISNEIKLTDNNFKILTSEDKEYLLININYILSNNTSKYFIFNNDGNMITKKEGITVYNNEKYYINNDNEELNIFYGTENYQILAKVEDNYIYSLEEKKNKKELNIEEYKYFIKNGKLEKEKVFTYDNIKIREEKDE